MVGSPHQTPDTSSDWTGLTSETSENYGYFHPFWRNFHPKFRYLNAIHKKTGRGGWAAKGVPCARFLMCPIINNTITKILFSVAFFHYWPHETSPGYSKEDVYSCFFDVSKFLNFSHESIDKQRLDKQGFFSSMVSKVMDNDGLRS